MRSPRPRSKAVRLIRQVLTVALALAVTLGIPAARSDGLKAAVSGEHDAVASATVETDQPSGEYYVLINLDRRPDSESVSFWETFFSGGEVGFIFEDIECSVAKSDPSGLELAQSFQSRLPENQMKIKTEDSVLLFSKADHGKFDILVLSAETADAYNAYTAFERDNVRVISVRGTG